MSLLAKTQQRELLFLLSWGKFTHAQAIHSNESQIEIHLNIAWTAMEEGSSQQRLLKPSNFSCRKRYTITYLSFQYFT